MIIFWVIAVLVYALIGLGFGYAFVTHVDTTSPLYLRIPFMIFCGILWLPVVLYRLGIRLGGW